ncbi:MAG: LysM peptidoglycan-binding domain-containing protein [Flavobacteriaceae bacterium]|jgi:hypothetical protein|nr:LysM peptidoglycan-binding domain-containing protein [Flavobacteriaceae bacterium]
MKSSTYIQTHIVQKGETLESVADQLGISAEALKRYHNTYCDLKNLIGKDIGGIYEIMIPPPEEIAEFKETQKHTEISKNLPSLYLTKSFYASNYQAIESFEQLGKEHFTIDYSVFVHLRETADKGFVVEVETSDFKKNGQSSDDKISSLSLACMESISPIAFTSPAQGKITGLYDHKTIIKRFETQRSYLENLFIGKTSQAYFNKFHSNLIDEKYLLKKFHSALLYQVLFPEMDWFHRKKEWEENFYLVSGSFPVKVRFHTEYDFENPNDTRIVIKGKTEESGSLEGLLRKIKLETLPEEKTIGEIELCYTIDKKNKQLQKAEVSIVLLSEEIPYLKHRLFLQ